MPKILNVFLHGEQCGVLTQNDSGDLSFKYHQKWLNTEDNISLSNSLPLKQKKFSGTVCKAYFGGILPEEEKRELIAKNLGISSKNDFSMLSEIGGECAGAVSFYPDEHKPDPTKFEYDPLSDEKLVDVLNALPKRPLLAGEEGIRLSLAGAQDKITPAFKDGQFAIPMHGAPSTHILKPTIAGFDDSVINEAFCMKLADKIGIPVAKVEVLSILGEEILSIERYDRKSSKDGTLRRIHQEDFCQALGIVSENKYQAEGGVSLKQAFDLVREKSVVPAIDLQRLLTVVLFNFLIGNSDAHGKNFSFLISPSGMRLAPFYDLLCTKYYPNLAKRMAMSIGKKYNTDDIYPRHLQRFAEEVNLNKPMVLQHLHSIADKILLNLGEVQRLIDGSESILNFIKEHTTKIKKRFE